MRSSKTWILLDSGIGGLVYAKALRQAYPKTNFVYIGDNENFPYGEKSLPALKMLLQDLLDKAESFFNVAGVLFACNTATVNCLKNLVSTRSYPIVGVHPFLGYSKTEEPSHNTLLLSTQATLRSHLVQFYIKKFPQKIKGVGLPALVQFAETGDKKWSYVAREEINAFKDTLKGWEIQQLYLGCTHFIALGEWLSPFFPSADLIDSRIWLVELFKTFSEELKKGEGLSDFYLTRESGRADYYRQKAKDASFQFKGVLS